MSARPRSRKAPQAAPAGPRRAERAAGGGLLRRFVERLTQAWRTRVETGGSASEVRIDPDCDRDGAPPSGQPLPLLLQQRNELSARLLVHDPARHVVRNLFIVHDELRNGGWAAVEALPAKIVDRALIEAEILATDEPSAMLDTVLEDLRRVKAGADARAELGRPRPRVGDDAGPGGPRFRLRRVRDGRTQLGRHRPCRAGDPEPPRLTGFAWTPCARSSSDPHPRTFPPWRE